MDFDFNGTFSYSIILLYRKLDLYKLLFVAGK